MATITVPAGATFNGQPIVRAEFANGRAGVIVTLANGQRVYVTRPSF